MENIPSVKYLCVLGEGEDGILAYLRGSLARGVRNTKHLRFVRLLTSLADERPPRCDRGAILIDGQDSWAENRAPRIRF